MNIPMRNSCYNDKMFPFAWDHFIHLVKVLRIRAWLVSKIQSEEIRNRFKNNRGSMMKRYCLKHDFKSYEKGTKFYVVAESEFIGVKEFVLRTQDLKHRLLVNDDELSKNFIRIYDEHLR